MGFARHACQASLGDYGSNDYNTLGISGCETNFSFGRLMGPLIRPAASYRVRRTEEHVAVLSSHCQNLEKKGLDLVENTPCHRISYRLHVSRPIGRKFQGHLEQGLRFLRGYLRASAFLR